MNKMFKKLLAATMAVSVAASMSVAFAADYKPSDSSISVTPTAVTAEQYTVMVFKYSDTVTDVASLEGTALTEFKTAIAAASPSVATIYYINQGSVLTNEEGTGLVDDMLVKATTVDGTTTYLPKGTYVVRIGNSTGSVENISLTVDEETVTILYGDVTGDGKINAKDVAYISRYVAKWSGYDNTDPTSSTYVDTAAADVTGDSKINAKDVAYVSRYVAKWAGYETLPKTN